MVCRVWTRLPGCEGHACAEQREGGTTRARPDVVGLSGFAVRNVLVPAIFAVKNQGRDQDRASERGEGVRTVVTPWYIAMSVVLYIQPSSLSPGCPSVHPLSVC